jgi:hypothetical protein
VGVTFGEGRAGITMDLLRRRVGEVFDPCVRGIDDIELKELAGVYCVEGVLPLDGVENIAGARRTLAVPGERPEPLEDGCDAGGDDCGGVPRVPADGSLSKNVSSSCDADSEYRLSEGSSNMSLDTCDARLPGVFCIDDFRCKVCVRLDCEEAGELEGCFSKYSNTLFNRSS